MHANFLEFLILTKTHIVRIYFIVIGSGPSPIISDNKNFMVPF